MYFTFTVPIPKDTKKISFNTIKGVRYVNYEYDRVYKPEKKYNVPKRTTIGRVSDDNPDEMYPNPNYLKYFPEEGIPEGLERTGRSSCVKIGTYLVIDKIIRDYHLDLMMEQIYEGNRTGAGLFLDLAAYALITENNAAQYYPDYAYNHALFTPRHKIYSDATVGKFINQISIDDSIHFQNMWNSERDHREKIYISYDSTNKHCQAGDIDIAEYGHSKDGCDDKAVFNYSVAYDRKNREPLFYEEYPGSIVDITQLQFMLTKAKAYGYKHAGFILDRGYFCKENLNFMDKCGYDFVIMVKGMRNLVSELILDKQGSFEKKRTSYIHDYEVYGTTEKKLMFPGDEKERYFHLYYSASKCATEMNAVETKIDKMTKYLKSLEGQAVEIDKSFEKYFRIEYFHKGKKDQKFACAFERTDVVDRELTLCGYFSIITSERMTAEEAIDLYKSRDASEKLFKSDKSFLGNKSLRVHSPESADAKIFIAFVALIIRNRIYTMLKDEGRRNGHDYNFMNVPAAIRELEKIEMIRQSGEVYLIDHAITANQKTILKAFGMDKNYVLQKARMISEELNPNTLIVEA